MRSVNYRLIWNVYHENEFQNLVTAGYGPLESCERKAKNDDAFAQKRVSWYKEHPEFELYDLRKVQYELHNIAADPAYQSVHENLKSELDRWMEQQGIREYRQNKCS